MAYAIFGVGFGFVNAPITNAAVSGMRRAQAGVAAAIATTSRRFGQTLGVALVGAIIASRAGQPGGAGLATASHPAWWTMAAGSAVVLILGRVATAERAETSARRTAAALNPTRSPPTVRRDERLFSCRGRHDAMSAPSPAEDATTTTAREVWTLMSDLVLDHQRRREVSDALGISFGRTRAIRRLARQSMSMRGFAEAMGIDPPNATAVVDDLESLGLVRRRPHPTDRRAKVLEATRKGKQMARRADAILGTPPPALAALSTQDLQELRRILQGASRAT